MLFVVVCCLLMLADVCWCFLLFVVCCCCLLLLLVFNIVIVTTCSCAHPRADYSGNSRRLLSYCEVGLTRPMTITITITTSSISHGGTTKAWASLGLRPSTWAPPGPGRT